MRGERRDRDKLHGDQSLLAAMVGNACRGKVRHPSKRHALSVGRQTLTHGTQDHHGLLLSAYKCRACASWHIGHAPRRHVRPDEVVQPTGATFLERALADALRPYVES